MQIDSNYLFSSPAALPKEINRIEKGPLDIDYQAKSATMKVKWQGRTLKIKVQYKFSFSPEKAQHDLDQSLQKIMALADIYHIGLGGKTKSLKVTASGKVTREYVQVPVNHQQAKVVNLEENAKEIRYDFAIKDRYFGSERVSRQETIHSAIEINQRKIAYLTQKLFQMKKSQTNSNAFHQLKKEIEQCRKEIQKAEDKLKDPKEINNTWIDTEYYRRLFKEHAADPFEKTADRTVIAPTNFRYHNYHWETTRVGFYRLGVISDFSNGWTNLKELKEMKADEEKLTHKIKELKSIREKVKGKKTKEAIDFAIKQMSPGNLGDTIEGRSRILQGPMLQLVNAQLVKKRTASPT